MSLATQISQNTSLAQNRVESCLTLLNEGCTLPFIARYRKEATQSLNELDIKKIIDEKNRINDILKRKETILSEIESQGRLTDSLRRRIEGCFNKQELEDIYLPYKPKRATRAQKAIDAGLKPVANFIRSYHGRDSGSWKEKLNRDRLRKAQFNSDEEILKGISDIIAAEASENIRNRNSLRKELLFRGEIDAKVTKEFKEKQTPFQNYYDKKFKIAHLKSHQTLALFRGEKEKVLRLKLLFDDKKVLQWIESSISRISQSPYQSLFHSAAKDCLKRLLGPSIENEIRTTLKDDADAAAITIFGNNLETILMAPPAGTKTVIAIDPGFRTGCKVAVLDKTGKYLEHRTIYPTEPKKDLSGATKTLLSLIDTHKPSFIAIGNGTGGRETEHFVKNEVLPKTENSPTALLVNESGASIYSASEVAVKEFPELDLTIRGAISIGRRLQDPLVELVKIDPKSIGVGQYQHDVNQPKLKEALHQIVENTVNRVGVNVNLASAQLLEHISGLTTKTASEIVLHRNKFGPFTNRTQLKKIKGIGPKAFEQCAGFLRIAQGDNPLDNSAVHPESYDVVEKISNNLKRTPSALMQNPQLLETLTPNEFIDSRRGLPTILDIFDEIRQPGRDPREQFAYAEFDATVNSIDDLHDDMILEGVVTNLTAFGAFVDIGVHQDGLVHISEMADRFVSSPSDIVSPGDIVKVRVFAIEKNRKRISLSMKEIA